MSKQDTYRVVRFFKGDAERVVIFKNLTLEQAEQHCRQESTSGDGWFDGYERE